MKKLRAGRRVGVHLYLQEGPEPADTDPPVGTVFTEELAARIVEAVNAVARIRELHHPERRGPDSTPYCNACGRMMPCPTIRILEDQ